MADCKRCPYRAHVMTGLGTRSVGIVKDCMRPLRAGFLRACAQVWALVISVLLVPGVGFADIGKNVLLGRSYTLTPPPNYDTAKADAGSVLTDGAEASGSYWRNGTTLGWTWKSPAIVDFALAESTSIGQVRVQAGARKAADIFFLAQILVYGGDASGRMDYLGSSELLADVDSPADNTLRQFVIIFSPRAVSRIVVVGFARGAYMFLGEIAAFSASGGSPGSGLLVSGHLGSLEDVRNDAVRQRRAAIAALPRPTPLGPDAARRWAMPVAPGDMTADVRNGRCTVSRVDLWSLLAAEAGTVETQRMPLIAIVGGRDYAAWRITNGSDAAVSVRAAVTGGGGPAASRVQTAMFALAHVQALDYAWVPDVVAPFSDTELAPGSAIVVVAELSPKAAGRHALTASIRCGQQAVDVALDVTALQPAPTVGPLHGNLWADLSEPVASALGREPRFLARFGVTSADVNPGALLDTGGPRPTELLRKHFRAYRELERVMLYMDIKTRPWAFIDMDDDAAVLSLRRWWEWVQSVALSENVRGELVVFAMDEPRATDAGRLGRFLKLARRAGITAPQFATMDDKTLLGLLPLDIVQVHRPTASVVKILSTLRTPEVHGYDTQGDGRLLSTVEYYRQQGWRAFELGLVGTGLWAIWDGTGLNDPATGWNPFGVNERDFGLIYGAPDAGQLWPSRRLLAWARGREENRIMRQCATGLEARTAGVAPADWHQGSSVRAAKKLLARSASECGP